MVLKKLGAAVQALTWSHFNGCVPLACLYCRARMNKAFQLDFCTVIFSIGRMGIDIVMLAGVGQIICCWVPWIWLLLLFGFSLASNFVLIMFDDILGANQHALNGNQTCIHISICLRNQLNYEYFTQFHVFYIVYRIRRIRRQCVYVPVHISSSSIREKTPFLIHIVHSSQRAEFSVLSLTIIATKSVNGTLLIIYEKRYK